MILLAFLAGLVVGCAVAGVSVNRSWNDKYTREIASIREQFEEARLRGEIKIILEFPEPWRVL